MRFAGNLVISQVYGGGGNANASYTHDFIEIFNLSATSSCLSTACRFNMRALPYGYFGVNSGQLTELPSISLQPGQYLLVQEASQAAVGAPLPTADVTDATPIAMAAGAGKVALVADAASLDCNGGSNPCGPAALARIVDLAGYGSANFFEGAGAAPTLSSTSSAARLGQGCQDTDSNSGDFASISPPGPRYCSVRGSSCGGPPPATDPSATAAATPASAFGRTRR